MRRMVANNGNTSSLKGHIRLYKIDPDLKWTCPCNNLATLEVFQTYLAKHIISPKHNHPVIKPYSYIRNIIVDRYFKEWSYSRPVYCSFRKDTSPVGVLYNFSEAKAQLYVREAYDNIKSLRTIVNAVSRFFSVPFWASHLLMQRLLTNYTI